MRLMRTLSHVETAEMCAEPYKNLCQSGDAILTNYFKSSKSNTITFSYIKLDQNGDWRTYVDEFCSDDHFVPFWKYDSCLYKFNDNI